MDYYGELARLIAAVEGAQVIGFAGPANERFPLYRIVRGKGKKVLLSGVVHGNEPAGAFALIEFFRSQSREFEGEFEFTAFPCMNPWGYQHYERENGAKLDLNRHFEEGTPAEEIRLILPLLESYIFAMDLHEDDNDEEDAAKPEMPTGKCPEAFYFWEYCEDKSQRVGDKIVANVEAAGIKVCKWPKIWEDTNSGGVIWYPEGNGSAVYAVAHSFEPYLIATGRAAQVFTLETFREQPMEKRVLVDIIAIKTVLEARRQ
ncbi:hypothetical protein A2V54_02495 [candidate division WWE3 bacterium RBG_19FT_COMBO_53_11]|uniref:Succinylglutamate desuccinylase/Aspartoacylase catalytic domain-containing protein n=1 Tax=candidate division WWE3 bacterium RBG_19FT_COMBO_53_11 TaxID=1802613 RepID=A0A1F4UHJ7_UNCKA|nr:MAG: hypothetical protein A2155_00515 [candidate division WWE3 bacterium RBG_16_52_45]OGC44280.1 MAG: hypothetical protein A2V54_02495 [candidate division WWE3 bacterium RBG_19FT_COMBO_53_11]